jgi:hypothetical protein
MNKIKLAEKIEVFLKKYAGRCPDNTKEYTSPDAYALSYCALRLKNNDRIDTVPWSEWGSGGYKPYSSQEGKKEHEEIMTEIEQIIHHNKSSI